MRSYLTSKRLMTKLGMLRSGKKSKALVVVEGMTDYRVYGKFFDLTSCEVIIGESKENVVEAIKMCEEENLQGIIGIVDADFWHVQSTFTQLPKALFMTDYHDLECMMLHSKAFEYVFLECMCSVCKVICVGQIFQKSSSFFVTCCKVRLGDVTIYETLACQYSTYFARIIDLICTCRHGFAL